MGRLAGYSGRQVRTVAESLGWIHHRTAGDHFVYKKSGQVSNLSIPDHREVKPALLRDLIKTMGLTPDEFVALAKK